MDFGFANNLTKPVFICQINCGPLSCAPKRQFSTMVKRRGLVKSMGPHPDSAISQSYQFEQKFYKVNVSSVGFVEEGIQQNLWIVMEVVRKRET